MSENTICTFCNKQFSNIYNLKQHQKIAKYCLQLQNNLMENKDEQQNNNFECEFCSKVFTKKSNLKTHYISCKLKKHTEDKEEIEKIEFKHTLDIQKLETKHKEEIERLCKELEKIEHKHKEEIEKIEHKHKEEIEDYKTRLQSVTFQNVHNITELKNLFLQYLL